MYPEFLDPNATLESLFQLGWYIDHSSGGGWWFRNKDGRRQQVPFWIQQATRQAMKAGGESFQWQLKELLTGDIRYMGPCPPWTPDPKKAKEKTK